VAQWLDDHLHAAPLAQWLPALLQDRRVRTIGVDPPRALRRLLEGCAPLAERDDAIDVLVHTGELWHPLPRPRIDALCDGGVLLDLAWLGAWRSALRLRAWRRAPGQRAAADRLAALLALGLREPQQWICATGAAVVVTLALRRG
jgi:hypothetical protein